MQLHKKIKLKMMLFFEDYYEVFIIFICICIYSIYIVFKMNEVE